MSVKITVSYSSSQQTEVLLPNKHAQLYFVCPLICWMQGGLYENVSPEVMASARPLLTGNPAADADIIKFYQAKAALLSSQPLPLHVIQ